MKEIRYIIERLIGDKGDEWMESSNAMSNESQAIVLAREWSIREGRRYRVVRTIKTVETDILCQYDNVGNVRYGE